MQWTADEWQVCIEDGWWHEVLRLYAAQTANATPLVRACMQVDTAEALKLAENITKEALKVDRMLRERMTKALVERTVIRLRSTPETVFEESAPEIFGISDVPGTPLEYIQNDYEAQDTVVIDHATGLMWQRAGSENYMIYNETQQYIQQLNQQKFAGHSDWRLPTIPELMSLLEPEKHGKLYIDPIFDATQIWCWSSDLRQIKGKSSRESAWLVVFHFGYVSRGYFYYEYYVRCVRSRQ